MTPPPRAVNSTQQGMWTVLPEGTPSRTRTTGKMAAKTAFAALHTGAARPNGRQPRPGQVTGRRHQK